ncbi:monosaccharide ABC transporter membrane protein (CUT2 family) [Aliiruegeria haliotis]|uniref:Monosaccharide ABC transporter membrane protein (CUT2 family) n=1 Tax=Aliiruegeria haliotis TaxID=1280846 RepID=A0A2T0REU2_9RHOB|nr:ABC transporter permease [Aliiruegeria haliotis]PRY19675.1 monosaccharide ABC transporter membrane protein (CUT2 family) [Aliiruegeria haliotis]
MSMNPSPAMTGHGFNWRTFVGQNDAYLALIVLIVIGGLISPEFLTTLNLKNLLSQSAVLGILAAAQFMVILIAGFDLSVAAVMALSSVVFAQFAPIGLAPAAVLAVLSGLGCGAITGAFVTLGRVQPLIATLAMLGIARGFAFTVSEKSLLVDSPLVVAMSKSWGIISVPMVIWLVIAALLSVFLYRSRFGLHCLAIGGREQTAALAGVPVQRTKFLVYVAAGGLSALAGIVLVIRTQSGVPHVGNGWELASIAAVVLGGTALFGGEGQLPKAMAGVLIYQTIANLMNQVGLNPYYQDIVRAIIILAVVGVGIFRVRQSERRVNRAEIGETE